MNLAATELVRTSSSIAQIGRSVGYSSVPSFTRAFAAHFGCPPGEFRTSSATQVAQVNRASLEIGQGYKIDVLEQPEMSLVGLWHDGDYMKVGRSFEKVFSVFGVDAHLEDPIGVGVYFQDPSSVEDAGELRSFAGLFAHEQKHIPEGFARYCLPKSYCAMLTFRGPHALLESSYTWFCHEWLPGSGLQVADRPPFELYISNPRTTAPKDLITKVCVPLVRPTSD